jgi:hypothetical protein
VISAGCFYRCDLLESLRFEAGLNLQRIEKSAFADTLLSEVEFPNSVRFIDGCAFDLQLLESVSFIFARRASAFAVRCLRMRPAVG